jgi:DNA-binding MarR family transcriptional regulator
MEYNELTMRIAAAWRDLRRIKASGLSIPLPLGQIDTLDAIARLGECSMLELSEALRIDASTATRAVEPLVRSGLVLRERSERDGRTVLVSLTREGRRVERQLTVERLANVERTIEGFSPVERRQLADYLERLVAGALARDERGEAAGRASAG